MIIDSDAHINEDVLGWTRLADQHPDWIGPMQDGDLTVAAIEGRPYPQQSGRGRGVPMDSALAPATIEGAFDLDRRLADMDTEGIDLQVLYGGLSIGVSGFTDLGFARDFARQYNDWLLDDICSRERLFGSCAVPLQDVDTAVEEVRRAAAKGAVAVTIPPVVGERTLDDPSFLPFFEAVTDLDLAVGIHNAPGMHTPLPAAGLFDNYVQVHVLSFPVEQMVAFTALAFGGVFDRFPTLRVAFLECGVGWVPYFLDRSHEHFEKRAELVPAMKSDPREFIRRRQCFFTFEAEDPFVEHYIEHLGADTIMFASDYPHWDCEFPGTVATALKQNAGLDQATLDRIMADNARALYRL